MMTSLFSMFDPSMSVMSIVWLGMFIPVVLMPVIYWMNSSSSVMLHHLMGFSKKEMDYTMKNSLKGSYLLIISLFTILLVMNLSALFPFIFSLTSHLMVTSPLAYSIWMSIIIYSWAKSFKSFLVHLIPSGTPMGLMSFMILVEILSNLIRPLALTFRLTANMMAGHLLMSLIGGFLLMMPVKILLTGSILQMLLTTMELGVAVIQAYVMTTLLMLYLSETE